MDTTNLPDAQHGRFASLQGPDKSRIDKRQTDRQIDIEARESFAGLSLITVITTVRVDCFCDLAAGAVSRLPITAR